MADAIVQALDQPFEEALRFFRQKASVTTRTWTDVYAAAHSHAFMVAGAATDAIVADFRAEIEKALAQGTTIAEFRKGFDDIVARHGWEHTGGRNWRSRIIFDTNLRTAYAAGRYAKLTAPDTLDVFPYWQYNHSGSLHPRKEHLAWDGLVLRADEIFWSTNYPPNGWHCGCFVTAASDRDLRRQGKRGPDEAPELLFRAEEVGGRRVMVPFGVDPGFEYNPGQAWLSRTSPGSATVAAAPGVIARFVQGAFDGKHPAGSWVPVATAPPHLAGPLQVAVGTEIRLSADTIRSHEKHRHATADFYATAPELLVERGELIERPDGRHVLIGEIDGDLYAAAVKVVRRAEGDEIYLVSLRRTNDKQLARLRRGGKVAAGK